MLLPLETAKQLVLDVFPVVRSLQETSTSLKAMRFKPFFQNDINLTATTKLTFSAEFLNVSTMYQLHTLYKQPSKFRFISTFSKCSTTNMSEILTASGPLPLLKNLSNLISKEPICAAYHPIPLDFCPDVLLLNCIYTWIISMLYNGKQLGKTVTEVGTQIIYSHSDTSIDFCTNLLNPAVLVVFYFSRKEITFFISTYFNYFYTRTFLKSFQFIEFLLSVLKLLCYSSNRHLHYN